LYAHRECPRRSDNQYRAGHHDPLSEPLSKLSEPPLSQLPESEPESQPESQLLLSDPLSQLLLSESVSQPPLSELEPEPLNQPPLLVLVP
jgi:hypothetical protein